MRVKRNYALVMALVCLLAVAVSALCIYLYNPSLFTEQELPIAGSITNGYVLTLSLVGWLTIIGVLGLGSILRNYHQPKWIRYSIWINLAVNVFSGVVAAVIIYTFHWSFLANLHRVLPQMAKFYMLFAFLFVPPGYPVILCCICNHQRGHSSRTRDRQLCPWKLFGELTFN